MVAVLPVALPLVLSATRVTKVGGAVESVELDVVLRNCTDATAACCVSAIPSPLPSPATVEPLPEVRPGTVASCGPTMPGGVGVAVGAGVGARVGACRVGVGVRWGAVAGAGAVEKLKLVSSLRAATALPALSNSALAPQFT